MTDVPKLESDRTNSNKIDKKSWSGIEDASLAIAMTLPSKLKDSVSIDLSETPKQMLEHIGEILHSFRIWEYLKDRVVTQEERKGIQNIKFNDQEIQYLIVAMHSLVQDNYQQDLIWVVEKELGMTFQEVLDTVTIEFPDGRKKLIRHILIEERRSSEIEKVKQNLQKIAGNEATLLKDTIKRSSKK